MLSFPKFSSSSSSLLLRSLVSTCGLELFVNTFLGFSSWVCREIVTKSLHVCIYVLPVARWMVSSLDGTFFFFFKFLFIFRERGRGEKERERNIDVWELHGSVASRVPPAGDLACSPGMCPDWELNQQPSGLQASTQSTELQQSEHLFLMKYLF